MTHRGGTAALLVCALLWLAAPDARASTLTLPAASGAPTSTLTADRIVYDKVRDRVVAEGRVTLIRDSARLTMDRLTWERATGLVTAEGHVEATDPASHFLADRIEWRLNEQTGAIHNGRMDFQQSYFLDGALISRLEPNLYDVSDGIFSTCACPEGGRRDWSVRARSIRLRPGGTLVARGVRFRIKDRTILYSPVFFFPTSPRQTGLLIPEMGWDSRDGIRFFQPFYWAISPSQDLTVALDVRTRRGEGGDIWYRYMTSPYSSGEFRVNGLYQRDQRNVRGRLRWNHVTRPPDGLTWWARVDALNDRNLLRDLSYSTEDRTSETVESDLFFSRRGNDTMGGLLIRRTTGLRQSGSPTVQQLPELRLIGFDRPLGPAPLWLGGGVDAAYLRRSGSNDVLRMDTAPVLSLRIPLLDNRVTVLPQAGARLIWYSENHTGGSPTLTEAYPFSVTASAQLAGVFLRRPHLLVPEISYRYVPVNAGDAPVFDALDQPHTIRQTLFRLNQRLGDVSWKLSMGRDLENHAALPVRSELSGLLDEWGEFRVDSFHNPGSGRLERLVSDARITFKAGQLMLGETVEREDVRISDPLMQDSWFNGPKGQQVNFQQAGLLLGPWRGWQWLGTVYYDQQDHRLAEADYRFRYERGCWSVEVGYQDLTDRHVYHFQISLTGIEDAAKGRLQNVNPLFDRF